ncbi:MAG: capsular polysaccharide biosynthesis protein, partial [Planctomycetota bacterium]
MPAPRTAGALSPRRLYVFNGGLLWQRRVRRILELSGWQVRLGLPARDDWVGVWGKSPTSARGTWVAAKRGARLLRIEDAFLRSIYPGRRGEPPLGLLIDRSGVHFDGDAPSDIEALLAHQPLSDTVLLDRAQHAMSRIKALRLSKYNAFDCSVEPPAPGYVLLIDQTRGDASLPANAETRFLEMVASARDAHPGARILVRSHPETEAGLRPGLSEMTSLDRAPQGLNPWLLLDGATAVYTLSSGLGFEAILGGHKPHVFGTPFYAGWGLTTDHAPTERRGRTLTPAQLFAAMMSLAPSWYDPYRDELCSLE